MICKSYRKYSEDRLIRESYGLIVMISEDISFDRIKSIFKKLMRKISNISKLSRMMIIKSFVVSVITTSSILPIVRLIDNESPTEDIKSEFYSVLEDENIGDATKMRLSQRGWDLIKEHEGYSSKGYDIGDGMITIGWGHAEKKSKSQYKVGQEITKSEASEILKSDLKVAADGVRRIFKEWKSSDNYVPITQDMFDALVSIAFNSGVSGIRNSNIIKELKLKNYDLAAENIKVFKVSDKFKGLSVRREKESKLFLSKI